MRNFFIYIYIYNISKTLAKMASFFQQKDPFMSIQFNLNLKSLKL